MSPPAAYLCQGKCQDSSSVGLSRGWYLGLSLGAEGTFFKWLLSLTETRGISLPCKMK